MAGRDPLPFPDPSSPREPDAALEALVQQYAGAIRSAVRRVAGARAADVADEVAQGVAVGLWRRLRVEQDIERPASYIYRAAIRETVRVLRKLRSFEHEPLEAELEQPTGSPAADPERRLASERLAGALEAALSGLSSERERAVRAHLLGFAVEEIMRMNGWSYQRARNLVARGMADLRSKLKEAGVNG